MNTVSVTYIIDDTSKEIYQFEKSGGYWYYTGIYYVHRNDKDDVWGDEWKDYYEETRTEELDTLAREYGYSNYIDMVDWGSGGWHAEDSIDEIYKKYNPVCQKTERGKTYYSGMSWGIGNHKDKPNPKITKDEIIKEITIQVSKVKIKL